MTDRNRSPLAIQVGDLHEDPPRSRPVFRLVVHCTGRSIVERALRRGVDPLEHAIAYYRSAACSCHYIGGHDGTLVQITADDRRVPHVGVSAAERQLYLSRTRGCSADARLSRSAAQMWHSRWACASPQHLFSGPSANDAYVGIELLPLERRRDNGLWYTDEQHELVAGLAEDLRVRHGWPAWPTQLPCPRLLGHEDLDAFGRWDRAGGWDPGALRRLPRFNWSVVADLIRQMIGWHPDMDDDLLLNSLGEDAVK